MADELASLLKRAGVPSYYVGAWFAGCALRGSVLEVPDRALGEQLVQLFGPALRAADPRLTVRVVMAAATVAPKKSQPPSYLNAKGRKWWATQQRLVEE